VQDYLLTKISELNHEELEELYDFMTCGTGVISSYLVAKLLDMPTYEKDYIQEVVDEKLGNTDKLLE
jgi:hypothetical protein